MTTKEGRKLKKGTILVPTGQYKMCSYRNIQKLKRFELIECHPYGDIEGKIIEGSIDRMTAGDMLVLNFKAFKVEETRNYEIY